MTRRATNSGDGAAFILRSTLCQARFTRRVIRRSFRNRIIEAGVDISRLQIHQPDVSFSELQLDRHGVGGERGFGRIVSRHVGHREARRE